MNPDQIQALIQDFEDRAAAATCEGHEEARHFYSVAADIVRGHLADAAREAARPAFIF